CGNGAECCGGCKKCAARNCHGCPPDVTRLEAVVIVVPDDISDACQQQARGPRHDALAPLRNASMSAPVSGQSLSRVATPAFMKGSDSEMARSLSPRWS